jgi:pyruvate,water dikinase
MIETGHRPAHEAGPKSGFAARRRPTTRNSPSFLVKAGIDTISVTPDSFVAVKTQRGGGGAGN